MTAATGWRSYLVPAAAAALVALVALAIVWALRPAPAPTVAEQADLIAAELRCPDCHGLSVADSPTAAAAQIRREIRAQLDAGATPDQIRATFVARYGDWILLRPPGIVPWLIPILAVVGGVALWLTWLWRGRGSPEEPELDTESAEAREPQPAAPTRVDRGARTWVTWIGATLVAAALIGLFLPPPFGLANPEVLNSALADAQAAENARQAQINDLLTTLQANPSDIDTLSSLADAYLAGSTSTDLQKAAVTLLAIIQLDPERTDAYTRLVTAYIRAADWANAQQATDALAALAPGSIDVPFFNGLIAWRGRGDATTALAAFDEFLSRAPDDPRVTMIRALRAEAAAQ
jgi:cytochrome c-type biogenesis protein CcmH